MSQLQPKQTLNHSTNPKNGISVAETTDSLTARLQLAANKSGLPIQKDEPVVKIIAEQDSEDSSTDSKQSEDTASIIKLNLYHLDFSQSKLFPGSVSELTLRIGLKQEIFRSFNKDSLLVRVHARCLNLQYEDLGQYVFSVRNKDDQRSELFQEMRFRMRNEETVTLTIAAKMPNVSRSVALRGELLVQVADLAPIKLPISAVSCIPCIRCPKALYNASQKMSVIKIIARQTSQSTNHQSLTPIQFVNESPYQLNMEACLLSDEDASKNTCDVFLGPFTIFNRHKIALQIRLEKQ